MAFHGAAAAAAVVTAAGARNVPAAGSCKASAINANCIFNSEVGSGGAFQSTNSHESRRESVMNSVNNK